MQPSRRAGLALLMLLAGTAAAMAQPAPNPPPRPAAGPDLLPALRAGVHVAYIRRARTERDGAD